MEYRTLGRTGLKVSRLCFGVLTMGPLQANMPPAEGVALLRHAVRLGVNFFDTAEIYETYPYLRALVREVSQPLVITSKCYAVTADEMRKSLDRARQAIDRDYIDIFMLHEQESALTLAGHHEALEYLFKARERGLVKAVGISTHRVAGVLGALQYPDIDVIHPLFNKYGLGIQDGSIDDMRQALERASLVGKGIYLMKALGGGHLLPELEAALRFNFCQPFAAAVAVGMKTFDEIDFNVRVASGLEVPESLKARVSREERHLHIDEWCEGCGECARHCPQQALSLGEDNRMRVDVKKCLLCGYCAGACPNFFIKVY
jgi:aryl-alcohol dehydrogenase-like predicted oxidoreductase/ferredoxin